MYRALALALLCLCVPALNGCGEKGSEAATPSPSVHGEEVIFPLGSPQLKSLTTAAVEVRQTPPRRLTGRLVWDENRTVRVYCAFAGRVTSVLVQPGDRVKAGQALAMVGSPDFGQAQAEARRARAEYGIAQDSLERVRDLAEHGVAAGKDLKAAEADFERARVELARVDARRRLYGGSDSVDQRYVIHAPLAGVVVERNLNFGQEVRPDQVTSNAPPLFVITDPTHLWVLLDATEHDIGLMHAGQRVVLRAPSVTDALPARIDMISDFIDPTTRVIRVRGSLANREGLLKGEMFVSAEIDSEGDPALVVPAQAVFLAGERHYVFVAEVAGRFRRAEVLRVGEVKGGVTVRSALKPGQQVVVGNALLLQQLLESGPGS